MAGTIHELWSCGFSEEETWHTPLNVIKSPRTPTSSSRKVALKYSHAQPKESFSSWAPAYRGLPLSGGLLSVENDQVTPFAQDGKTHSRVVPDESSAFVTLLHTCIKNKDLHTGTKIHDDVLRKGLLEKCSDALVTMYAKCGELAKAKSLLDMHGSVDVISWTALIAGYARAGLGQDALDCFECMRHEGIRPDAVTYARALKACGTIGALDKGEQIHDEVVRQGLLGTNNMLGSALVDMYAKCGALSKAQRMLEELPFRDNVTWNALIAGYAHHGEGEQALNCLARMQHDDVVPDAATYACILKACGAKQDIDKGKQIHDEMAKQGLLQNNIVLGNALVDMYAKCGALSKAQDVLEKLPSRNVVSWSTVIAGYSQQGQGEQALNCFEHMQGEGIPPNAVTYTCILSACGTIGAIDKGKRIHDEIVRQGLLQNDIVLGSALVDMYAKCGALPEAQHVLEEISSRNVISWSTLIAGYAQQGQGEQALNCFERMQREGIAPNAVTYACILKACGTKGDVDKGKQVHEEIARQGLLQKDIVLGSALVDMYAKCGALVEAQCVLEELPSRDVVSWSALIAGYAQQGQGKQALNCFERMQREGIPPDIATFGCVLNVCSHLGLVEEGHVFLAGMSTKYGLKPDLECYTCMIDLYGRAGLLEKAVGLIEEMPSPNDPAIWHALLGACWKWGDVNVGRWAFDRAVHMDKMDGPTYVLMENIYAASGMQENARKVETMRIQNKAWKNSLWK